MNNNKGFTLVELLTVIVILVSVSLVVVSGISSSLDKRYNSECTEQQELAKNAAKIYFALHPDVDVSVGVQIRTLKENKYFNETSKTNRLKDDVYVKIENNEYKYVGECKN